MIFNNHSNLEGQHAFLGASKYHWINYDETKVADAYSKFLATQRGTVLHDFACQCITLGQKLPKSQKTLNMYVNDAISFRMVPEQILFYSENCFGTADTIVFRNGTVLCACIYGASTNCGIAFQHNSVDRCRGYAWLLLQSPFRNILRKA